jgi:hypothetical protein
MEQSSLNRALVHVLAMQQYQIRALLQILCQATRLPAEQVQGTMRETWTLEGRQTADALWRRFEQELATTSPEELNLASLLDPKASTSIGGDASKANT